MGFNLYMGLGVAGLLVLAALFILFWPKGQGASPKVAAAQLAGLPPDLGRVDAKQHARNKIRAQAALKEDARCEFEGQIMLKRAAIDAAQEAALDAQLTASVAASLGVPSGLIPAAAAPSPAPVTPPNA